MGTLTQCGRRFPCALCPDLESCGIDINAHDQMMVEERLSRIARRVLVLSNKGGVGTSTVCANLAIGLAARGLRVGLADCDIAGPSIRKMFGLTTRHMEMQDEGLMPAEPVAGLKVAPLGSLPGELKGPEDIHTFEILQQLYGGVNWGDLDWLIVDMPGGIGGELLGTAELMGRIDGAIVVTTPQTIALDDVRRAIQECEALGIPVLGIVENMSGMACPHCGDEVHPFSSGGGAGLAAELGVRLLAQVPLDPQALILAQQGHPALLGAPDGPAGKAFASMVGAVVDNLA